uniref:Uncharacterized protein n=1 Tax=Cucumis melo TaxID=3656 RepID=A0A9I9EG93_CUCME
MGILNPCSWEIDVLSSNPGDICPYLNSMAPLNPGPLRKILRHLGFEKNIYKTITLNFLKNTFLNKEPLNLIILNQLIFL